MELDLRVYATQILHEIGNIRIELQSNAPVFDPGKFTQPYFVLKN